MFFSLATWGILPWKGGRKTTSSEDKPAPPAVTPDTSSEEEEEDVSPTMAPDTSSEEDAVPPAMTLNDYIAQEEAMARDAVTSEDVSTEATNENTVEKSTKRSNKLFNTKKLAKAIGKRRYEHFNITDEAIILRALEDTIWAAYHCSACTSYHRYTHGSFVVAVVYIKDPVTERVLELNDLTVVRHRNRALVRKFLHKADSRGGKELAYDCGIGWYRIRFAIEPTS